MDKIVELVTQKTGIPKAQAEKAVDVVMDYLKNAPQDELMKYVGFLGDGKSADAVKKGLGSLFGK